MQAARSILLLLCLPFLFSGCATRGSVNRARADIAALGTRLEELRRAHDRLTIELATMTTELRESQARLTTLLPEVAQGTAAIQKLGARVDATEAVVTRLQTAVEHPGRDTASPPAPAGLPAAEPDRARASEPAAQVDVAARVYAAALEVYRSREYGQAVLDFLDFIGKYPTHPLASNAQYWIGEAYYVQRDYRQAMLEFRKVLDNDPRGNKVPDALLKLGFCFLNLHQPSRAHELWQQVVRDYPKSEVARKARALLLAQRVPSRLSR